MDLIEGLEREINKRLELVEVLAVGMLKHERGGIERWAKLWAEIDALKKASRILQH